MANKRVKDIMSRFKGMKDIRKPHEARMKAVSEYILPNREILMHGREKKGEKTHAQIFDGSPQPLVTTFLSRIFHSVHALPYAF